MDKIELKAPASWGEMTVDQLKLVVKLMRLQLTREELLLTLFLNFTGVKKSENYFITIDGAMFGMEDYEIMDFCNRISFILDEMPCDIANPTTVDGHLNNISFGNYFHADALMYGYRKKNDKEMVRSALRDLGMKMESIDDDYAELVALWWSGVQQWLKQQYPLVFADGDGGGEGYNPLNARQNILLMLTDGRPQDNKAVERAQAHDVLGALEHKIEQAKEMERRMK